MKQSRIVSISFSSEDSEPYTYSSEVLRRQLALDDSVTYWDVYLTTLITQCRKYIEKISGKSLITRTVTATIDYKSDFSLPYGPLSSITSISQKTGINEWTAITANEDYELIGDRVCIYTGEGIYRVVYTVTAESGLNEALLNEIIHRYENRGDVASKNQNTIDLVTPYKDMEWLA